MAGPLPVGGPLGPLPVEGPLGARWGPVGPVGPVARRARSARRARQGFGPSGGASLLLGRWLPPAAVPRHHARRAHLLGQAGQ